MTSDSRTTTAAELFRLMARIRCFEEIAGNAFYRGQLPGGVHLSIGQEGVAAAVGCAMQPGDRSTSTHRGHGDLIAVGADVERMFAEVLGRATGSCGGKGGSMHITETAVGSLGANGIVGGGLPTAVGSGLSSLLLGDGAVTVAFFGDGAVNTGSFHESLNLAAVWKVPVVFVCENNQFGQFTRTELTTAAESIAARAAAYGIPTEQIDGRDAVASYAVARELIAAARAGDGPQFLDGLCYRLRGHNEGDEKYTGGQQYRDPEEVEAYAADDPLKSIVAHGHIPQAEADRLMADERGAAEAAFARALEAPEPDPADATVKTFAGAVS